MKTTNKLVLFALIIIFAYSNSYSQFEPSLINNNFYLDVVLFKSNDSLGRVDFYVVVPYKSLSFTQKEGKYAAEYTLTLTLTDSLTGRSQTYHKEKTVIAPDYFIAQGGGGNADFTQKVFTAVPGIYKAKASILEKGASNDIFISRTVNVLNFSLFPFSMSGILILSSIEENNGSFKITPFVSDNVGDLREGYFAFFETYNSANTRKADFVYELTRAGQEKPAVRSKKFRKTISSGTSQNFLKIEKHKELRSGKYILRLIALKPEASEDFTEADYLAVAERTVNYLQSIEGIVLDDIALAIRQLRYIANSKEYEYIISVADSNEREARFWEFWESKDPYPNTPENEALEDYYKRVETANKNFGTYSEGWLTDRGMVFIIFGPPNNIERARNSNDGRMYERWIYEGREFIFGDNSGFGDFRLMRPYSVTEKYVYGRE